MKTAVFPHNPNIHIDVKKIPFQKRLFQRRIPEVSRIAPMVDVVFVIMLFFMVMAGNRKSGEPHNITLPGDSPTLPPNEIAIMIEDYGQVYLNDGPLRSPQEGRCPNWPAASNNSMTVAWLPTPRCW